MKDRYNADYQELLADHLSYAIVFETVGWYKFWSDKFFLSILIYWVAFILRVQTRNSRPPQIEIRKITVITKPLQLSNR